MHTGAQNLTVGGGGQERVDLHRGITNDFLQFRVSEELDVFLDEIDAGFDIRQDADERGSHGAETLREPPRELGQSGATASERAGSDEVQHGFGLTEIEPAVQESAAGEFPGLGESRSGFDGGNENFLNHLWAAMTRQFDRVLTGIATRCPQDESQNFIDTFASTVHDPAVVRTVRFRRLQVGTLKQASPDRERLGTTQAQDRKPRSAGGGCRRHDRVLQESSHG
jgi:hypothetical protein